MMKTALIVGLVGALAACSAESMKTAEGCKIMLTELGQAHTRACQAAYHEEMARQAGGTVTRCIDPGGAMSCTTY